MTDADIKRWMPLRTQVLMGEVLSTSDQQFYETILEELDRTETFPGTHDRLEALMEEVHLLRKETAELRRKEQTLYAEIEQLDRAYHQATGRELVPAA